MSKAFLEESAKTLEEFEKRDLGKYDFIALVIDGKHLSKENIVIALGITIDGEKIPLRFIETTKENSNAIKRLIKDLLKKFQVYRRNTCFNRWFKGYKKSDK